MFSDSCVVNTTSALKMMLLQTGQLKGWLNDPWFKDTIVRLDAHGEGDRVNAATTRNSGWGSG
ncbi:MAG TPA: hypothetical protein DCG12_18465 [Planctomycetaceae bacterium]|nr:hypothetical protein [Planctomycetaceae bacterium]